MVVEWRLRLALALLISSRSYLLAGGGRCKSDLILSETAIPSKETIQSSGDSSSYSDHSPVYQMSVAWFFGTLLSVVATTAQDSDSTLTLLARSSQGASAGEWTNLNVTVDGRLHTAVPFELPCFSKYEGLPVTTDAAACTSIQENYTDPNFRAAHFGAYMDVSVSYVSRR